MDSLVKILTDKYAESRAIAEKSLSLIDYHLSYSDHLIVAVVTKYQEECDEAIRGMVACAFALREASGPSESGAMRHDDV